MTSDRQQFVWTKMLRLVWIPDDVTKLHWKESVTSNRGAGKGQGGFTASFQVYFISVAFCCLGCSDYKTCAACCVLVPTLWNVHSSRPTTLTEMMPNTNVVLVEISVTQRVNFSVMTKSKVMNFLQNVFVCVSGLSSQLVSLKQWWNILSSELKTESFAHSPFQITSDWGECFDWGHILIKL